VADAMRRIERQDRPASCDIYITNDSHQLVGIISLGKLLTSSHSVRLRDIMSRKTQPISAYAITESLITHPAWETRRRLPVVERDNSLIGALNYTSLRQAIDESGKLTRRDPFESFLSLAGLYWLSLAQLLDNVLSIARQGREER
jgi:Mg/Co/Ni transporter MgtE